MTWSDVKYNNIIYRLQIIIMIIVFTEIISYDMFVLCMHLWHEQKFPEITQESDGQTG